jgi:hypothetical protein
MCPSNGTPCGDCIAAKCCPQAEACLTNPACDMALQCVIGCVQMGGMPVQCFTQCGANPGVLPVAACAGNLCGAGICL